MRKETEEKSSGKTQTFDARERRAEAGSASVEAGRVWISLRGPSLNYAALRSLPPSLSPPSLSFYLALGARITQYSSGLVHSMGPFFKLSHPSFPSLSPLYLARAASAMQYAA